jgi:hypothetical protein
MPDPPPVPILIEPPSRTQVSEPSTLTNPGPNAAHGFGARDGGFSSVLRGALGSRISDCASTIDGATIAKTTISPALNMVRIAFGEKPGSAPQNALA